MKKLILVFSVTSLISCSFGGFKPPKPYYGWGAGKQFYSPTGEWLGKFDFLDQREHDMRSCGMDPVRGESGSAKTNLCLEQKGWYLEGGPVCENKLMWNDELCIKWRAKHSKPDAKPWG